MNTKLEMVKAYVRGSLKMPAADENTYMRGYDAAMVAVKEFIELLERPLDGSGKKNEDSQFSLLT